MSTLPPHFIRFPAFKEKLEITRILGRIDNPDSDKLVIICAGIHGNEPGAVFAAHLVFQRLLALKLQLQGTVLFLAGNIPALDSGQRFMDEDLNRIWVPEILSSFPADEPAATVERQQARELYNIIVSEAAKYNMRYYIDCHTTSSDTLPFISVHSQGPSYEFARQFPAYTVIESENTALGSIGGFFRSQGFTGFTFEAGQHDAWSSIENQEALMWLFLTKSEVLDPKALKNEDKYRRILAKYIPEGRRLFKTEYRYTLKADSDFHMQPGMVNFQPVKMGEILALEKNEPVRSPMNGRVFMPLYQEQGEDGFFVIREK